MIELTEEQREKLEKETTPVVQTNTPYILIRKEVY
jgi:hypothetical protein